MFDLKEERNRLAKLEGAGKIPEGSAGMYLNAKVMAAGHRAYLQGFLGEAAVNQAVKDARAMDADQRLAVASEQNGRFTRDIGESRLFQEANLHTSSDFAVVTALVRERVFRNEISAPMTTPAFALAERRVTGDFRPILNTKAVVANFDDLSDSPEAQSVKYLNFEQSDSNYQVAKSQLAVAWTYEMQKNGDIDTFLRRVRSLGNIMQRKRSRILLEAIKYGVARNSSNPGAPDAARITAVDQYFASRVINGGARPTATAAIHIPVIHRLVAKKAMQPIDASGASNVLSNFVPIYEDMMLGELTTAPYLASDWIAYAVNAMGDLPAEFTVLDDFAAGPQIVADIESSTFAGNFNNCTYSLKVMDACAATLINPEDVVVWAGA